MREYLFFLTGVVAVIVIVLLMVRCEEHRHLMNAAAGVHSHSQIQPVEQIERSERR